IKNSRPVDAAPCFTSLARFSFNGETPRQKISKVVAPRDTKVLFRKGNPWEALGIPLDTMNKPSPCRLEQTPSTSSRRPIRPRPKNQIRSTTRQKPQTRRIKNEDQRSKLK